MGKWQTMVNGDIITVPGNFQECLAGLSFNYDRAIEQQEYFHRELNRIRDEKWRDEELKKLKTENDELHKTLSHGFYLTPEEHEAVMNWIETHVQQKHHGNGQGGVIGGMFSYTFIPTSVGTIGTIKCTLCGENFTFSDI